MRGRLELRQEWDIGYAYTIFIVSDDLHLRESHISTQDIYDTSYAAECAASKVARAMGIKLESPKQHNLNEVDIFNSKNFGVNIGENEDMDFYEYGEED